MTQSLQDDLCSEDWRFAGNVLDYTLPDSGSGQKSSSSSSPVHDATPPPRIAQQCTHAVSMFFAADVLNWSFMKLVSEGTFWNFAIFSTAPREHHWRSDTR